MGPCFHIGSVPTETKVVMNLVASSINFFALKQKFQVLGSRYCMDRCYVTLSMICFLKVSLHDRSAWTGIFHLTESIFHSFK